MSTMFQGAAIAFVAMMVAPPAAAQGTTPPNCIAGPWTVFFDFDSDEVTPRAAAVLDAAALAFKKCGETEVSIAGHTDRKGSDQYNVGLSQRMAMNVRSYLAVRGVPDGAMVTQAFGESRPMVQTGDEVREPRNRRVVISFGPRARW